MHSTGLVAAPKVLADIVESLIGAIFLDSNSSLDTTWQVIKLIFLYRHSSMIRSVDPNAINEKHFGHINYKELLRTK